MDNKLNIAFVWHMHQPLYKDPLTGEYTLPWVLFHATKDYYDMAAILEEFPDVHQTFNLVPCLIEQINEYASGKARDKYRRLSGKKAEELGAEEKVFMLQFFFQANWEHMIRPLPRFWELLRKRGISNDRDEVIHSLRYFNDQDFLDLQVLYNLVWIDPSIREKDRFLSALYSKGGGYTEEEKAALLRKQTDIAGTVIPKYAELRAKGIIEVSTSPYYHPILPLLCDSDAAREAMPWATLPKARFRHPEDAREQVRRGLELFKDTFGAMPRGMWPSEGSVSMDVLPIVASEGVEWLATDEEILSNTLRRPIRRDHMGNCYDTFLYKPYEIDSEGGKTVFFFRDHVLSDLIGFDYSKMDAEHAASDMLSRLTRIHGMLENPGEHVVPIILDGENAWEHFRNDGRDFLRALYSKLSSHPALRCVTISEFLDMKTKRERLDWLFPGSWINHNFKIWIGHVEDNTAWDYISEARDALVKYEEALGGTPEERRIKENVREAWEEVYAAEGSDWFWWYGEEHSSMSDEDFDALFRRRIKRIYQLIGNPPPDYLEMPISSEIKGYRPPSEPRALISPNVDGIISDYFEWLSCGKLERTYFGSAMHKELQGGLVDSISYGFSRESLFFRFDYIEELGRFEGPWSFTVTFMQPRQVKAAAKIEGKNADGTISVRYGDKWGDETPLRVAADAVVEVEIPLSLLDAGKGDEIKLYININAHERGVERWPVKGYLIFTVPPEDFEQQDWIV